MRENTSLIFTERFIRNTLHFYSPFTSNSLVSAGSLSVGEVHLQVWTAWQDSDDNQILLMSKNTNASITNGILQYKIGFGH